MIPEIVASLGFGWVVLHLFHQNRMLAVSCGGVFLAAAMVLMLRIRYPQTLSIADV